MYVYVYVIWVWGKGVKEDSRRVRVHMFLRGRADVTVSVRD